MTSQRPTLTQSKDFHDGMDVNMLASAMHYEKQLPINPTLANTWYLMEEPK